MKICAMEAMAALGEFANTTFDVEPETFAKFLKEKLYIEIPAESYSTLEDILRDFVQDHVG